MITTYIGMGSNLGDSQKILSEAIVQLQQLGTVRTSKLYQSPPMGPQDQPNYLNAVAELKTELDAHALLDELQRIEQESGRVRLRHWGERTLDLDLLIYGAEQIKTERLTVPHPGVMERDFVVIPLLVRLSTRTVLSAPGFAAESFFFFKQKTAYDITV